MNGPEKSIVHGGDLTQAMALIGDGEERRADWLDLSTGVSPFAYRAPAIAPERWSALPERRALDGLLAAAAHYYGAAQDGLIAAGPGSEALLQALPHLFDDASAAILGPTYCGHASAWRAAGHKVRDITRLEQARPDEILVMVNPNNPDGRSFGGEDLAAIARRQSTGGGWLVVDEAFGDAAGAPGASALAGRFNVAVLKSFGKFFGLPGLRLGFLIAPQALAARMRALAGSWPVSTAALDIGTAALNDQAWQDQQRARLDAAARRLDGILTGNGIAIAGGTALFRLGAHERAGALFHHLLERRVYTRPFDYNPHWLRFGLPGPDDAWARLVEALDAFRQ